MLFIMDQSDIDALKHENIILKNIIRELEGELNKSWDKKIDDGIEKWFELYKDEIDIGRISVMEIMGQKVEIDVLPDYMEKAIYKKCVKIMFSLLKELK